jgi:hypothetical protein
MVKRIFPFLLLNFFATIAFAGLKKDTSTNQQHNTLGSKFYFPNSIGLSVPFNNDYTHLKTGFAINAGIEFRPQYIDAFFYRVDLDILSNNYTSYVQNVATNIIQGKLASDFILAGAGYRKKIGRCAIYAELLPGLGLRSFDRADINPGGVVISRVTNDSFAAKTSLGFEYYLKQHFDIFVEPAFYKYFSHGGFNDSARTQLLGFNIGIATARF